MRIAYGLKISLWHKIELKEKFDVKWESFPSIRNDNGSSMGRVTLFYTHTWEIPLYIYSKLFFAPPLTREVRWSDWCWVVLVKIILFLFLSFVFLLFFLFFIIFYFFFFALLSCCVVLKIVYALYIWLN